MNAQEIHAQIAATRDPVIRSVLRRMAERQRDAGTRFAALRSARGFTQQTLAEKAGVAYRTIQAWEAGAVLHPRPGNVKKVAAALRMKERELRAILTPTGDSDVADLLVQRIEAARARSEAP